MVAGFWQFGKTHFFVLQLRLFLGHRQVRGENRDLTVDPGKENFDVKAGRSSFVFIKEEGD